MIRFLCILILFFNICSAQIEMPSEILMGNLNIVVENSITQGASNTVFTSGLYVDVPFTVSATANPFVIVQGWTYYKAQIDSVKNTTDNIKLIQTCYKDDYNFQTGLWYEAAPSSGVKNYRVYVPSSGSVAGSVTAFYGVHQTTPIRGTSQTTSGTSATPSYADFATANGDRVFSCILYSINAGNYWANGDGDSTYLYLEGEYTSGDLAVHGRSVESVASTYTYDFLIQTSVEWVLNICSIRRAVE